MDNHVMSPLHEETGVSNFCMEMQVLVSVVEVRPACGENCTTQDHDWQEVSRVGAASDHDEVKK